MIYDISFILFCKLVQIPLFYASKNKKEKYVMRSL